jgi:hypothetical protein
MIMFVVNLHVCLYILCSFWDMSSLRLSERRPLAKGSAGVAGSFVMILSRSGPKPHVPTPPDHLLRTRPKVQTGCTRIRQYPAPCVWRRVSGGVARPQASSPCLPATACLAPYPVMYLIKRGLAICTWLYRRGGCSLCRQYIGKRVATPLRSTGEIEAHRNRKLSPYFVHC